MSCRLVYQNLNLSQNGVISTRISLQQSGIVCLIWGLCTDCVLACAFVIAWVSSVRFRHCLSAGIVGLTALSRQKVIHTAENCFPGWKNSHQPNCSDLIEALQPWNYHSNYFKWQKLLADFGKYVI